MQDGIGSQDRSRASANGLSVDICHCSTGLLDDHAKSRDVPERSPSIGENVNATLRDQMETPGITYPAAL